MPTVHGGDEAAEILERFHREAWAAARVAHPNVCPVYDVGEVDGWPYLTMAYIQGAPLTKYIRGGKPPEIRISLRLVRKLALALAEAHKQGIVHRELKPANVMVDQHGEPILIDFGLARLTREQDVSVTQTGVVLGSPACKFPEHLPPAMDAPAPRAIFPSSL